MFSLIQLEYIVAVDTYGQFSIAAEKCFVTQPTLSMQIKKMESDLDVVIFDRSKQPVVATEVGQKIVNQARNILAESQKIDQIIQSNKDTIEGDLRIGIIPSIAPYLLPKFIGGFSKKYPDLNIHIKEKLTEEILADLDKELLDVGIVSTPIPNGMYQERPIYYEQIYIYCHSSHPFFNKKSVSINELAQENIWLLSQGHCFRSQVINICALKDNTNELPFTYESASIETLVKMVDKQGGITLIPELAVNDLSKKKQEGVKPIKELKPVREVGLITNRIFVKQRVLDALETAIKGELSAEIKQAERGERVDWK